MDEWTKKQEQKINLLKQNEKLEKAKKKILEKTYNIDRKIDDLSKIKIRLKSKTSDIEKEIKDLEKAKKRIMSRVYSIDREIDSHNRSICEIEGHSYKEATSFLNKIGIIKIKKCEICGKVIKEWINNKEEPVKTLKKEI